MAPELRMTLLEHLSELRTRLLRWTISVLVLGGVALFFSKPLFQILMRPVLAALPEDSRALIYTSGIEELNVLMKVGLYGGVFLSTPVLLWQIWRFVAPGLHENERRFASPFVFFGSVAFIVGILFGYFVLLPPMFQFLLNGADSAATSQRLQSANTWQEESLRYLRLGELPLAAETGHEAAQRLAETGDGQTLPPAGPAQGDVEAKLRLKELGALIDAAHEGLPASDAPTVRVAMAKRVAALQALQMGDLRAASGLADESAALLSGAAGDHAGDVAAVWAFQRQVASGQAQLAAESWTRPLLTMSEQLTLVLTLLLAMGVIFELPLVMSLLASLGLVKASFLMKYQRHAFVICLIIAAVVTPTGDAINLSLMAGPMILCYELGVLGAWLVERRRKLAPSSAILPAR